MVRRSCVFGSSGHADDSGTSGLVEGGRWRWEEAEAAAAAGGGGKLLSSSSPPFHTSSGDAGEEERRETEVSEGRSSDPTLRSLLSSDVYDGQVV